MVYIVHPDKMLRKGLVLLLKQGQTEKMLDRKSKQSNIDEFKGVYGKHPLHISRLWRDLQLVDKGSAAYMCEEDANNPAMLENFLWALYFLKVYPKEKEASSAWQKNRKTLREAYWPFIRRIAAMAEYKIVWPAEWKSTFIISVDGTDVPIREPRDPTKKKNPKWFSKKLKRAGLGYELALHLFEDQIVHASTHAASIHDIKKARKKLVPKIPEGKRVIADRGYFSKELMHIFATPNAQDSEKVKTFKKDARARQETLNSRLSQYGCIDQIFRHGVEKHEVCFMACLVMTQYAIEDTGYDSGEPLMSL
jgi:IS5 family transposase